MSEVKHIANKEEFEALLKSKKPVLVDFSASWCGPCQMMAPVLEEMTDEKIYPNTDKVEIAKVDIDENRDTAMEYGVMSVPTFYVFLGGKPHGDIMVGMRPQDELIERLDQALKETEK